MKFSILHLGLGIRVAARCQLVLLRMLSFQGEYSNRIKHRWVGEVERVPWV